MKITNRLYTYPVLSPYSNDYISGTFDVKVEMTRSAYELQIEFIATLDCESLYQLIENGKACFLYHIECSQTAFRKIVYSSEKTTRITIKDKEVNGHVNICTFIVAAEDLKDYTSPCFNEDYDGLSFDIETGCVLAVSNMIMTTVNKERDELKNVPSIFTIIQNKDTECEQMLVEPDDKKIIIKLPNDSYAYYKLLSKSPSMQCLLNSLTVIPALSYVLGELKSSSDIINDYSENAWYKVICRTLKLRFACDIENGGLEDANPVSLAQKMIDNPFKKAIDSIFGLDNTEEEDET